MANKNNNFNPRYRNFYVLGDSLSDSGALCGILEALSFARSVKFDDPFYQNRSFSNGPVAVEYLAKYLDLEEFKPGWSYSLFGRHHEQRGQNYAVSYASASEISEPIYSYFFNKFRLANQLDAVVKHHPNIGKEDLFFIMIGGNDIMITTAYDDVKAEAVLERAVSEICSALKVLDKHGVKYVVVANAPDIGLIPAFNKNEKAKVLATKRAENFNAKLASGLDDTKKSTDLEIKIFDLNSKMKTMLSEYKNKGLNYQNACISDVADQLGEFKGNTKILLELIFKGKLGTHYNPGCSEETLKDHFFFDYFHPTTKPHHEVSNELYALIKNDECELIHAKQQENLLL
ncbi:SGNH/GDSL hydrolase family protein [Wolbachia endosymbiont of Ctenocephalides felis wCfeJ]|uniref:SGNH/GDSL hydrolase family protein n=1 Tax=Wolbachia endosymbiont of Ctenocephalides felis wCfeJ TaxID=2732594 RepID=UPI0014452EA5|nr:SGNH/GDSL hydrolase family protein [Wolbachia endosymbiont of Ctenocephalides felis wCfeJ]WCR57958.1 MAG: Esterase EstA [Wolbachia endosymbiont of Ctenocephalides felis wCfeJ]